jgi:iron complex outermembrane receptor protein
MYGGTARAELDFRAGEITVNPYLAYTYSDGDIDDKKLPFSAKHTVKAGLDLGWRKLSLSTRLIGRSSATHASLTDADGNPTVTPGSLVVNTHFLASDLVDYDGFRLAAFVDVRNALDARYAYVSADANNGFPNGAPQDPRRIMIGAIITFKQ